MDAVTPPLHITITPPTAEPKATSGFWQDDSPSFKDVLDTINPLQHIPIVSNLYQSMTGDIPSTGAKIAGGTLFGGALGLLGSIIGSIIEAQTGKDIGGNLLAALTGDSAGDTATSAPPQSSPTNETPPAPERFVSASRRSAYNAYVSVQSA